MKKIIPLFCILFFLAGKMANAQAYELWGTTYWGGLNNAGVIMNITEDSAQFTWPYSFDTTTGYFPKGSLIFDKKDTTFYGVTLLGGADSSGTIFSYKPLTNVYTDLFDFDSTHGSFPNGSLVEDTNKGVLYGMTSAGGAHNLGVIFGYVLSSNTDTDLHDFDSIHGVMPLGNLLLANDTTLYGMTELGGIPNNDGVIFNYNPHTHNFITLYDFNDSTGMFPSGSLIQDSGKLYGMTPYGGANDDGVIFSYDLSDTTYTDLLDFNYANGSNPNGSLLKASNGLLYGMTENGIDSASDGVIFSFNPDSNTYSILYVFTDSTGGNPAGSFIQGATGDLYATTQTGGYYNDGVIFSFNPDSNSFDDMYYFDNGGGGNPYSDLVETLDIITGIQAITKTRFLIFPNPSSGLITIVSPTVIDAIRVTDLLGRVVYVSAPKQSRLTLNLKNAGMYFVTLTSGTETATSKIIISK